MSEGPSTCPLGVRVIRLSVPFTAASAVIGQGSAGAVPPPAVPGQMGRTQTGPYEVRSSTMGIMTVSMRAGCETGPVNSTV